MNKSFSATPARRHSDIKASDDQRSSVAIRSLKQTPTNNEVFRHHYPCAPSYHPIIYPGCYHNLYHSSIENCNHPSYSIRCNSIGLDVSKDVTPVQHFSHIQSNLSASLRTHSMKDKSILDPHAKGKNKNTLSPNQYIDPNFLKAARALNLPPDGQKYSIVHWKGALVLCYRWKTTTSEYEQHLHRTSTSKNSSSSKSIKFFCENVIKRKSKRRQFAIHWKESSLKQIVEAISSSEDIRFDYNDQKLERIIDDYFSGRTRSSGYNKAKERVLDDRQKYLIRFWDELMSGSILSDASSHEKLYLIQLAIERPYRKKEVESEAIHQKVAHDVAIEGYGGPSYWEEKKTSQMTTNTAKALHRPASKFFNDVLPINEAMNERFWKCANSYCLSEPKKKRFRKKNGVDSKNSLQIPLHARNLLEKGWNKSENNQPNEAKENQEPPVAAV